MTKEADLEPLRTATLVVDALFGTGLKRPISPDGLPARAVRLVADGTAFVVSVDVPSGLSADEPLPWTPSVRADLTVTFGYPKPCHVRLPAAALCGRIGVAGIGFLPLEDESGVAGEAVGAPDVAKLFPRRDATAHKGTFGRLLVVGGSEGMAGAPALAARGAAQGGSRPRQRLRAGFRSARWYTLLSPETTTAGDDVDVARFDALAVGPGLGASAAARALLQRTAAARLPAVFDADALNLAGEAAYFASRAAPTVLTPHAGEAGRLLGIDAARVNADREAAAARDRLARRRRSSSSRVSGPSSPHPRAGSCPSSRGTPRSPRGDRGRPHRASSERASRAGSTHSTPPARPRGSTASRATSCGRSEGEESLSASDVVEALPEAFFEARESAGG